MARILVVDDEEMDRVMTRAILESAGHELLYAADGEVALKRCREEDVELVVSDLAMPGFNGLRFIKELREAGLSIPLIAVSARAQDQLDLALDYGANFAFTKPVDPPALLEAVGEALNLSGFPGRRGDDPWQHSRD